MSTAIEPVPLLEGVYRKVEIGVTVDGQCLHWSVGIATHIDGVMVVGNGHTLELAAQDATNKLAPYKEEAA